MRPSIRTFLLINLLSSVTLVTSLAIIGNLFLEHTDIERHLDSKLTETALTLLAMTNHPISPAYYKFTQERINAIPELRQQLFGNNQQNQILSPEYQYVQFQIWSQDGKLLLHSYGAPKEPLFALKPGFSDININNQSWRTFTMINPKTNLKIVVAEEYNFRNLLQGGLTQDSVFIMLISYPLLGLFIWVIVGRGLNSLNRIAHEVSHRAPAYLEPVDTTRVPIEIIPLIDELNNLFIRLHEAFDREKRFAADAAHELRTPLAALKAQAQVALNAVDDSERKLALAKVTAGVDRSTHVIQQLLTLSRMVPEAIIEQVEPVDLAKQAAEVIAELAPEAIKKQTELELAAPAAILPIEGNPIAIGILIRNLVTNAIRYTPDNSFIWVKVMDLGTSIMLKVIDNGPGIPQKYRERVFERFFRILGNKAPGSGLGLAIVQRIAELHQAHIELCTPESGKGLEVRVNFPKTLSNLA